MKKILCLILAVVAAMCLLTSCLVEEEKTDSGNQSVSEESIDKSTSDESIDESTPEESVDDSTSESESDSEGNVVQPIFNGGSFNGGSYGN